MIGRAATPGDDTMAGSEVSKCQSTSHGRAYLYVIPGAGQQKPLTRKGRRTIWPPRGGCCSAGEQLPTKRIRGEKRAHQALKCNSTCERIHWAQPVSIDLDDLIRSFLKKKNIIVTIILDSHSLFYLNSSCINVQIFRISKHQLTPTLYSVVYINQKYCGRKIHVQSNI